MYKLKLYVMIGDRDEPTMFNLDPDVTANELVEIIKEDEGIRKFTFGEWYNDIDQEIFKYGLDDGSIKMVDLLWVDDFSEWHTVALKHKTARGKSPSFSNIANPLLKIFDSEKKFTLMNATHEKLFFEVRYAAESQRIVTEAKAKNVGVGVAVAEAGGNFELGLASDVKKEVNYAQNLDKAEEYDLDPHCVKKITINKGHFTGVIYVEVFQIDKDQQKIVTRTNSEGWNMGAETISLSCGDHYIILPGTEGEIKSVLSANKWKAKNGMIYEPHGCISKEKRCPKCDFLTQRDGWMYGKPNFDDIHPRAGLVKINEESAKCHLYRICGFKCHLNCDHE